MPSQAAQAQKTRSVVVRGVIAVSLLALVSYSLATSLLQLCRWIGQSSETDDESTNVRPDSDTGPIVNRDRDLVV
jgi:hypothetical protein